MLYSKIYPTGSSPGLLYGTAKLHRVKDNRTAEDLPLRPIILNIGKATYKLVKHLAQILKLLDQSHNTIKCSKSFMKTLKKQKICPGYQMVPFDVVSLFTNVPLEGTINIIIKRISTPTYRNRNKRTTIPFR